MAKVDQTLNISNMVYKWAKVKNNVRVRRFCRGGIEVLNDENFTTEVALNSSEALKKFESFKPDLIILDVWLGNSDLDGIELLKEFKKINLTIPIIIISGHGTVDMAVQAIKNGAYDFL